MEKMIYDAEQHIDFGVIEKILKENYDKKIVCFGGGTAADILMKRFLKNYKIECFIDNDESLHEKNIYGISIKSPKIIPKMKKGSFIILILSRHLVAISEQLKEYGLRENKDFYDIYSKFSGYFRIKKYEDNARKFLEFIDRIPDNAFDSKTLKQGQQKIGIVCLGEMLQNVTWYSMAQSILLRYNGYSSTLIIDTMRSFDSYIYFAGIEDVARIYIDYVIKHLLEKCPDIDVEYVDEYGTVELDEEDIKMTEKYAPLVVKWFYSQKDEVFLKNDLDRVSVAKNLLHKTMKKIKSFFGKNQYDTINVFTGFHRHRCVYTYIGRKNGIRVSTYDADRAMGGITLYETDGVSGNSPDITKLIKSQCFNDEEKQRVVELSKENFNTRLNSSIEDDGYNYQPVLSEEEISPYDVIIPLNIFWDSAALGVDFLFKDETEWLRETLKFLMENTKANVMIREHPAQVVYNEFEYRDYKKEINIINRYSNRIFFASAESEINTYQYVNTCKVVLPYTSTIGIEAALLGKNVVLHTDVYYAKLGIAYQATTQKDYFERINFYLYNSKKDYYPDKTNAYLAYYCQMKHYFKCEFIECFTEWMKKNLLELNEMNGVNKIIGIIAENKIAIYENIKEELERKQKENVK